MKKFNFSLERVLQWRRTQAQAEEVKLEQLHAEQLDLTTRLEFLAGESGRAKADLLRSGCLFGSDLEALDQFHRSISAQVTRVSAALETLERQISVQIETVGERRRQVKLVEQLRDDKFAKWRRSVEKEIEQQAEEAHLARFESPLS